MVSALHHIFFNATNEMMEVGVQGGVLWIQEFDVTSVVGDLDAAFSCFSCFLSVLLACLFCGCPVVQVSALVHSTDSFFGRVLLKNRLSMEFVSKFLTSKSVWSW